MNIDVVRNWKAEPVRERYDFRRTILYALGVGAGPDDLHYVYEKQLKALPTMAVVLAPQDFWFRDPRTGIDWTQLLHGEQTLEMHRPLPPTGEVIGRMKVEAVYDKGADKGALLIQAQTLHDAHSDELIATLRIGVILRGDGGFSGNSGGDNVGDSVSAPRPHPIPERPFDLSVALPTRPEQAALYRLSGDFHALHIDPDFAREVGFERPILHGLCTYAVAGRALINALCDGDPDRLKKLNVRFSSPVFPGETLVTEIWREQPGRAAFRVRVKERNVIAINNGLIEYS